MLLNLYGCLRKRCWYRKDLLLGVATILFFAVYIYSRTAGVENYSDYAGEEPEYNPAYYADVQKLGIGEVGAVYGHEDSGTPQAAALPAPKGKLSCEALPKTKVL